MADQLTLPASTDRAIGSRSSRRLRREGKVPAVIYGAGDPPTPIAVEWSDLRAALTTPAGMNALITLEFDGDTRLTIVKDMQRDPVRRDVTHVDFIIIDRTKPLDVDVPIPNELIVDCTNLTLDDPIRAESIALPDGVELNVDPEEAIVTASVPVVEIPEPVEGEEGEGEEGAEGEAAEGGDDAEASGGDDGDSGDDAGDDD